MFFARRTNRRRAIRFISTPCSARHCFVAVAATKSSAVRSKTMGWNTSKVWRIPSSMSSCSTHCVNVVGADKPVSSETRSICAMTCGNTVSSNSLMRCNVRCASSSVANVALNHGVEAGRTVKPPSSAMRCRSSEIDSRKPDATRTNVSPSNRTIVLGAGRSTSTVPTPATRHTQKSPRLARRMHPLNHAGEMVAGVNELSPQIRDCLHIQRRRFQRHRRQQPA